MKLQTINAMRRILISAFFCLTMLWCYCQDVIILMKRDSLKVVVTKVTTDDVEFHYPNESLTNVISKKTINKIIFGNGRIEVCHERKVLPIISSSEDWEKVLITLDKNEVLGLTPVGNVVTQCGSRGGGLITTDDGELAIKTLKIQAAKLHAPIILITDGWDKKRNRPQTPWSKVIDVAGIAYK